MNIPGSSRQGIPAERDRQTIQNLHVAIERGTLLRSRSNLTDFAA
jgi:hypothetical protein